jgi:hypothetical protein
VGGGACGVRVGLLMLCDGTRTVSVEVGGGGRVACPEWVCVVVKCGVVSCVGVGGEGGGSLWVMLVGMGLCRGLGVGVAWGDGLLLVGLWVGGGITCGRWSKRRVPSGEEMLDSCRIWGSRRPVGRCVPCPRRWE